MAGQKVFIISGKQGEGKTSLLKEVLQLLKNSGKNVVGFVAEGSWKDNMRSGFSIVNIQSEESITLCSSFPSKGWLKEGRFYFNPEAIAMGKNWLGACESQQTDVAVIDEIGIFELKEKIWHPALQQLLESNCCQLIITVRESIIEQLVNKYKLLHYEVFSVDIPAISIVEKLKKY